KFRTLDQEMFRHSRRVIAKLASSIAIPKGYVSTRAAELTDRALVEHEIMKARRHRPLRELMDRAGGAVEAMEPVFMMNPMSVAQFLRPGRLQFDVLIMDEASQIKPESAFGAIARAKQLIVVGDSKQLPPTDFFNSTLADGDDGNAAAFALLDSILDVAHTL